MSGYILGDTSGRSDGAMIGNYLIPGPESKGGTLISPTPAYHVYAVDNWHDSNKDGLLNGRLLGQGDFGTATWETTPSVEYPDVPALSAEEAFQHVMAHAGASLWRDPVDDYVTSRIVILSSRNGCEAQGVSIELFVEAFETAHQEEITVARTLVDEKEIREQHDLLESSYRKVVESEMRAFADENALTMAQSCEDLVQRSAEIIDAMHMSKILTDYYAALMPGPLR